MRYRATVRVDFDNQQSNDYQKLIAAFKQVGWSYVQTSSLAIETEDLNRVLIALELLGKQVRSAGTLTALSIDVQGSKNFSGIPYAALKNHPNALSDIRGKPFPKV